MNREKILRLSKKNIECENLESLKNILYSNYEISYGKYSAKELKKAIDNKNPVYIKNNFLIGYDLEKKSFINDNNEFIPIEKMVKAVIIEDEKEQLIEDDYSDPFVILGQNEWDNDLSMFHSCFNNLKIGDVFLPPHSAIFNFLMPTEEEIKENIVSCLSGVSINIYDKNNYVDNCMHEVGHLFWRDCLSYKEKERFGKYFKILKPSAIYEYNWERSSPEEMFCTIYKWYLKSILQNKSFYNILEHEESGGLKLFLEVLERIQKDKINDDLWELKKNDLYSYLNPKLDITTGKRIVKQGIFDSIKDVEIPEKVMNKSIEKFEDGIVYVKLNKAIVPTMENNINWNKSLEKKQKKKKTIFLDMDGVIAGFEQGYKKLFNRNAKEDDSFTVKQFCLSQPRFFRTLPVIDKGLELLNQLKDKYNIVFLTTPMQEMEFCKADKVAWIRENLGNYNILFSDNKAEYVTDQESILIDDMSYNLDPWTDAGGTAIKSSLSNEKILSRIDDVFNPKKEVSKVRAMLKNMDVNTNPSNSQKISGIYKKGSIIFKDLPIKIENPKGSIRWGFGEDGKKWITKMKAHYGYIEKTEGADYDEIDVFIGPKLNASRAFVVNQGKDNLFDEHKIILGCDNIEEAEKLYLSNYTRNWDGLMSIKQTNTKRLREWLKTGNKTEPFE